MLVKRLFPVSIFGFQRSLITFLCGVLLLRTIPLAAQSLPVGTRSLGMGGTYVALANSADAIFTNPGGLAQVRGLELSLFYQRPFGLRSLNYGALALSAPFAGFTGGIGLTALGNELYGEQSLTAAVSRSYGRRLFFGGSISYLRTNIKGYGSAGSPMVNLGAVFDISPAVRFGFAALNLNRSRRAGEPLPRSLTAGLAVRPDPRFILSFEVYRDVRFDEEFRFGAEAQPLPALALRVGAGNHPDRFSVGLGVRAGRFRVDYALFTHNDLGATHQVSLTIGGGRSAKRPTMNAPKDSPPIRKPMNPQVIFAERININSATIDELVELPGIGDAVAERIVRYREERGPFKTTSELKHVRGIGEKLYARIQDFVTVQPAVAR